MSLIAAPFRLVGYALLVLGTIAGFLDVFRTVDVERLTITTLGELLYGNAREFAYAAERFVRGAFGDAAWDDVAATVLRLPGWLALFLLGTLFLLVAQLIYRKR